MDGDGETCWGYNKPVPEMMKTNLPRFIGTRIPVGNTIDGQVPDFVKDTIAEDLFVDGKPIWH